MLPRFLAGIMLSDRDRDLMRYKTRELGLKIVTDDRHVLLAIEPGTPVLSLHSPEFPDGGSVVGDLYASGISHRLEHLEPDTVATVAKSAGQRLTEAYWGDYIAIVRMSDGAAVVRAPFGRLPCMLHGMEQGLIASSHLDDLLTAASIRASVDLAAVVRQLIVGSLRHSWTCLDGIEDLRGGDRITVTSQGIVRDQVWSPWTFVQPRRTIFDADEGARRLRHAATACVARRSAKLERPLLMLSGGLDSSVTAACLAAARRPFTCLNLITPADAAGDESDYARAVANHLGVKLTERIMGDQPGDISHYAVNCLPRPGARSFEQLLFSQAQQFAEETGCDGIIDGGAGDNVFCSLLSASPAADCLLDPDGRKHFRRMCGEIAGLVGAPRWKVNWRARRRAVSAERPFRWAPDLRFLTREGAALAQVATQHPWIGAHVVHLPGRAAHIAMIAAAQCVTEDGPEAGRFNAISPLLSQPLVEHCLAVPSWYWLAQGCNRAAARRAFEECLPKEVAWRRGKGAPDSVAISLFRRNRGMIRDHLVDGELATSGLIDIPAVLKLVDDPRPVTGTGYGRIMEIFDAESWARSYSR